MSNKINHFDSLLNEAFRTLNLHSQPTLYSNYPPFNVIKLDQASVKLELAVAGFSADNLEVEVADSCLFIRGSITQHEDAEEVGPQTDYIHRGISRRAFTRKFALHEYMVVKETTLKNGILSIVLEMVIPEEKKPKKVEINVE